MKRSVTITLALFVALSSLVSAQTRRKRASANCPPVKEAPERPLPPVSDEARRGMEERLKEARARYEANPNDPEAIIWLGRRTAYLGPVKDAIPIYTEGIRKHPQDARLYRHRGHRYITLRLYDLAIRDLERAASLIRGKPDEVEPDGLPNARNIPTSTLQSNIWYHLGLVYYLKGDFTNALRCYRRCMEVSKNPDMLAATSHWLYMTLRRLRHTRDAAQVLNAITEDMDIIENRDYHRLLLMYQGKVAPESLLEEASQSKGALSFTTIGYGVGNWYLYNRRRADAIRLFDRVVSSQQWTSFGYIAAEAELVRMASRNSNYRAILK